MNDNEITKEQVDRGVGTSHGVLLERVEQLEATQVELLSIINSLSKRIDGTTYELPLS